MTHFHSKNEVTFRDCSSNSHRNDTRGVEISFFCVSGPGGSCLERHAVEVKYTYIYIYIYTCIYILCVCVRARAVCVYVHLFIGGCAWV